MGSMGTPMPHPPTMEPSEGGSDPDTDTRGRMRSTSSSSRKHQGKQTRRTPMSNSTCPRTGASHTSLLDFDIHVCPRCNLHIVEGDTEEEADTERHEDTGPSQSDCYVLNPRSTSIGTDMLAQIKSINEGVDLLARKAKHDWSGTEDERSGDEEQRRGPTENLEAESKDPDRSRINLRGAADVSEKIPDGGEKELPSGIYHHVQFTDKEGFYLHSRPWTKPFDLTDARKGVEAHKGKAIARVYTTLKTDIRGNENRSEKERVKISKAGFFGNPAVDFTYIYQEMVIDSKQLIMALRAVVKYYPLAGLDADVVILDSPFCVIAHHIEELEAYKVALSDTGQLASTPEGAGELSDIQRGVTANHIGQLLKLVTTGMFGHQLVAEQARHTQSPPVCTFSMLWLLYKPGTTVYVRDDAGKTRAYIVQYVAVGDGVPATLERSDAYLLDLWSLDFDGTYVRRAKSIRRIGSFDGERLIMDLKVVPASFIDTADGGRTRGDLIQRGRDWYGMLTGARQWNYSGQTLDGTTVCHIYCLKIYTD